MPISPPHTCASPSCPAMVQAGQGSYCPAHKKDKDKGRGNRHERGYGNDWAKISAYYLKHHRVCVDPFSRHVGRVVASAHTDHVIAKAAGGRDEWDNFQALCASCHSYKTFVIERGKT